MGRPDDVLAVTADVSSQTDLGRLVDETVSRFGGVDVLVNNVGLGKGGGLMDTPDDVWQQAFDQTLFPAIRASRLVVPHMQRRGGGVILLIASIWGRESGGRMTYNAVKAAEISLGKALAQQLAPSGIRVNSSHPGPSCSRRILAPAATGRPGWYLAVRRTRPAVRPVRPRRRGR